MAEAGSREQFGALRKVLQSGEPGGPHIYRVLPDATSTLRVLGKVSKGQRGPNAAGKTGFKRLALRDVYTRNGARKGLGAEVTWIQLNSCTCLVLTFESSPRCPAFIPGSRDMSATG